MIRNPSKRMTVAQLKQRMDRRFETVDKRFDAVDRRFEAVDKHFDAADARMRVGFESVHAKLNAILYIIEGNYRHHDKVVSEHEKRLKDLEAAGRRSDGIH